MDTEGITVSTPSIVTVPPDLPFRGNNAYEIRQRDVKNTILDIAPVSTPCMFRLIDCKRFLLTTRILTTYEMPSIPSPEISYATISYPWAGLPHDLRTIPIPPRDTFRIKVAHDSDSDGGDPISCGVLYTICRLCVDSGVHFLWVDRLCIRQQDPADVQWHRERMHEIFKSCRVCVVVPSGLLRLANINEGTPWITRLWTLMEVLAAPKSVVVGITSPIHLWTQLLVEVLEGKAVNVPPGATIQILGRHRANHASMLLDVLSMKDECSTEKAKYNRYLALWKCVLARVTSRDEDLVLTILPLFDLHLTLDQDRSFASIVSAFKIELQRLGLKDPRVTAFGDAALLSQWRISSQWDRVIRKVLPISDISCGLSSQYPVSVPRIIEDYVSPNHSLTVTRAYSLPLSSLKHSTLDISPVSTRYAFRLLSCKAYLASRTLLICETPEIPQDLAYAAISYPWVGNPCNHLYPPLGPSFQVIQQGGRPGDAISVELLRILCELSVEHSADFLWLDRLCVRQMDREDKARQIVRMYDVYKFCRVCVVVPGGLQRLVGVGEETAWITRMWTLQEALVPRQSVVLYSNTADSDISAETIPQSAKSTKCGTAQYCALEDLLSVGPSVRLFGHPGTPFASMLLSALSTVSQRATESQKYTRYFAIWNSAVSRAASQPQDLLLSVMGLLDISLAEGKQRSSRSVVEAFRREFAGDGLKDLRVIAFRDAVQGGGEADSRISTQWKALIEDFEDSLPFPDRISLKPTTAFPYDRAGPPVARDAAGHAVFLGSALFIAGSGGERSLQPCKVVPALHPNGCLVPYAHEEHVHTGRYELLPFDAERMEWVRPGEREVRPGEREREVVPEGRVPVEGGYERDWRGVRQGLWFGLGLLYGEREVLPGKVGVHLRGCQIGIKGKEYETFDYRVLCWKEPTSDENPSG